MGDEARRERLAAALRANLRRRKGEPFDGPPPSDPGMERVADASAVPSPPPPSDQPR